RMSRKSGNRFSGQDMRKINELASIPIRPDRDALQPAPSKLDPEIPTMPAQRTPSHTMPDRWDDCADVVVVGYGYAGAVAAIEAHDAGAGVLILEKMPDPGGISITSGGNVRIVDDAEHGFQHLKAINHGTTPDSVLRALAIGM